MRTMRIAGFIMLVITLIGGSIASWFDGYHSRSKEIKDLKSIITSKDHEIKTWQDKSGEWHSRAYAAEIRSNQTLKYLSQHDARLSELSGKIDGLKSNLKNLQSYSEMAIESNQSAAIKGRDTIFVVNKDTVSGKFYTYSDRWNNIVALTRNDSMYCINKYKDSIINAVIWERKWLLGRKRYTQEVISENPNTEITYSRNLTVKKKR